MKNLMPCITQAELSYRSDHGRVKLQLHNLESHLMSSNADSVSSYSPSTPLIYSKTSESNSSPNNSPKASSRDMFASCCR